MLPHSFDPFARLTVARFHGVLAGSVPAIALLTIVCSLVTVPFAGCAPDIARSEQPIVGGTRGGDPAVLWIYDLRTGGMCTGSLIAPRVVLTAKHCVQPSGASAPSPPSSFVIGTGDVAGRGATYRALSVYATPGVWTEGGRTGLSGAIVGVDVAVVVLASEVVGVTPLPILRTAPMGIVGRAFTAVGYGQIPSGSAGVKYTVTGRIQGMDRNLIYVGAVTCQGDSGGPMILDSGEIVGVVSFGTGSCGSGYGAYNRIDLFMDMIQRALDEGGTCVPTGDEVCDGRDNDCDEQIDETCTPLGEPCERNEECVGQQCLDTVAGRLCATECDARNPSVGCEEGFYCAAAPGACSGACVPMRRGLGNAPVGTPCNDDLECASLFCTDPGDGQRRCLERCQGDSAGCLAGEVCATVLGACGACVDAAIVRGGRNRGEPCTEDAQCTSGLCLEDPYPGRPARRYCSLRCGTDAECGERFHCRGPEDGEGVCIAGRRGDVGDPCVDNDDCLDGRFCAVGRGTRWCTTLCDAATPCRDGFECVAVGELSVCAPAQRIAGDSCTSNDECISGVCALGAGPDGSGTCTRVCSPSTPCPTGLECRRVSDGTAAVCVWPPERPGTSSGGCRAGGRPSSFGVLCGLTALAGRFMRRRRGGRG